MLHSFAVYLVPLFMLAIPLVGLIKKLPVYDLFVAGAEEGLRMAIQIFPNLLAILVAVSVFRASGAFAAIASVIAPLTEFLGIPSDVLPLMLMRPLSGGGALALTADIITNSGPDSYTGLLASVLQGSTDTTFYVLSVYFGSVGISNYRYAVSVGLLADLISMCTACFFCHLCFA